MSESQVLVNVSPAVNVGNQQDCVGDEEQDSVAAHASTTLLRAQERFGMLYIKRIDCDGRQFGANTPLCRLIKMLKILERRLSHLDWKGHCG